MELKLNITAPWWICVELLIRPKWNWNGVLVKRTATDRLPFNQTKVELKCSNNSIKVSTAYLLLIRPKWNWNIGSKTTGGYESNLLIRPKWNWNNIVIEGESTGAYF